MIIIEIYLLTNHILKSIKKKQERKLKEFEAKTIKELTKKIKELLIVETENKQLLKQNQMLILTIQAQREQITLLKDKNTNDIEKDNIGDLIKEGYDD